MSMPRQFHPYQFDLFSNPYDAKVAQTPQWQTLPAGTRRTLTTLMVRLILDHVDGAHAAQREEADHDVREDRAASSGAQDDPVCAAVVRSAAYNARQCPRTRPAPAFAASRKSPRQ